MGGEGEGFRARAGALTVLLMLSEADHDTTLAILAEMATGVRVDGRRPDSDPDSGPEPRATAADGEFLFVAGTIADWLRRRPGGGLDLDEEAVPPLLALVGGWASATLHALAAEPFTVAEAQKRVGTLPVDTVGARIEAMHDGGLLEALPRGSEPCYAVTDWARHGIAPLAAAARMEMRYPPGDTAPIAVADVEAGFRLALPLLRLPVDASGSCALATALDPEVCDGPVGVTARIEEGRVVAVEPGLAADVDARAEASAENWLNTVMEPATGHVELSGDGRLAVLLLDGLHETLFGGPLSLTIGVPWQD